MSRPPTERTESLIAELQLDLEPVHRIWTLERTALLLVGIWLTLALPLSIWPGANALQNEGFLPTFACLGLLCVGGTWAALASCVPGRDADTRAGLAIGAGGLLGILALSIDQGFGQGMAWPFPPASFEYLASALFHDWICAALATGLALPIWGIQLLYGRRGFPLHPVRVALLASLASVSAGALVVHALCDEGCARHTLGSHALAPAWGGLILSLPALFALHQRRRGD